MPGPGNLRLLLDELTVNPMVWEIYRDHSLRVMYLASQLGRRLGVPDHANLRLGALLHDLGIVSISAKILLKPGPLNDTERTIVETHCHIGEWLCRKRLHSAIVAEYVLDHHERWDGTGYPRGLEGEEIPVQSRVIAACNVFDSLVYKRLPYREETLSLPGAIVELRRRAWTELDGDVVAELIDMLRRRPGIVAGRSGPEARRKLDFGA